MTLNWRLLNAKLSHKLKRLVWALNTIYPQEQAFHTDNFTKNGFQWIDCHDLAYRLISYIRKNKNPGQMNHNYL